MIGTGPYVLDSYRPSQGFTFKRNPDYWGRDIPSRRGHFNFERIRYRMYNDEAVAREAASAVKVEAEFVKVTDVKQIIAYDLMSTPGLVINEKLVSSGRIPTQAEVRQWLAT